MNNKPEYLYLISFIYTSNYIKNKKRESEGITPYIKWRTMTIIRVVSSSGAGSRLNPLVCAPFYMLDVANPECSMLTRKEFARIARDLQGINKRFSGIRLNRGENPSHFRLYNQPYS